MKINIISGWSNPGGSTTAHLNLLSLFNDSGYDAYFFGPHQWHTTKHKNCKLMYDLDIHTDDIIIAHFLPNLSNRLTVKKMILSLHEKQLFPLKDIKYDIYDKIHYLNREQKEWHGIDHPHFFCPNAHENLVPSRSIKYKIGGVIGSIDNNKQTHVSITRALDDGCDRVFVYGNVTDQIYFNDYVKPLVDNNKKILLLGHAEDKQKMYDSVSDVYMSSLSENQSYVADECFMTGTRFHGNSVVKEVTELKDNKYVLETWIKELDL